jgi:hypothetical protein
MLQRSASTWKAARPEYVSNIVLYEVGSKCLIPCRQRDIVYDSTSAPTMRVPIILSICKRMLFLLEEVE